MSEVLVCDMVPLRERGQYFGMLSGVYAIGTVLGPIIGGLFTQNVSWVSLVFRPVFVTSD